MIRSFLICLILLIVPAVVFAQEAENRAGLVVQFGDGRVVESCVRFSEETISGEELLRRAGLMTVVQTSGLGAAVCQIDGEGCNYPQESCFCKCQGPDCAYWSLQQEVNGAWRYANQGASAITVRDGDVYGWAWGAGNVAGGAAPPLRSLADICTVAPASTPTLVLASSVPATLQPSPVPQASATPQVIAETRSSTNARSYVVFALIALILGALWLFMRGRNR